MGVFTPKPPPGVTASRGRYDVIGASEGTDVGSLAPDSASLVIRALADHMDRMTAMMLARDQRANEQVEFDLDASNIPAGGFACKLPTGTAIRGYYVENNSANALTLFGGTSPSGRWLNTIAANYFKASPLAQQITSVCLVGVGSSTGLVRILLSTENLGPQMGSTIGAAMSPPSSTSAMTPFTVTTTSAIALPANPARVGATAYNNGGTNVNLGLGFLPTPANTGFLLAPYTTYTVPLNWKGSIGAQVSSGTELVIFTEFS